MNNIITKLTAMHKLNDALFAMNLLNRYLINIESKLNKMYFMVIQLHNTDTFSMLDGVAHELSILAREIDNIIDMATYNGKYLIINSSIESCNSNAKLRESLNEKQKLKYRLIWSIIYYEEQKLEIDPIEMSVHILRLSSLAQERGAIRLNTNRKKILDFVEIGNKIFYKQDNKTLAILVKQYSTYQNGNYYIDGIILNKLEGTRNSIADMSFDKKGFVEGITKEGKSSVKTKIDKTYTDPFSIFLEGNTDIIDIDNIIQNVTFAKDKCRLSIVKTNAVIDMINSRKCMY